MAMVNRFATQIRLFRELPDDEERAEEAAETAKKPLRRAPAPRAAWGWGFPSCSRSRRRTAGRLAPKARRARGRPSP